jgi:hypothetical protein
MIRAEIFGVRLGFSVAFGYDYPEDEIDEYLGPGEQHRSNEDDPHGGTADAEPIRQTGGDSGDHPSIPGPDELALVFCCHGPILASAAMRSDE